MATTIITAKFTSKCTKCNQMIKAGERCAWERGAGVSHPSECPMTGEVPVVGRPVFHASKLVPATVKIPAADAQSFGVDAILPVSVEPAHSTHLAPLGEVLAQWRAQIALEQLTDVEIVNWRSASDDLGSIGLYLRTTDGALMMGPEARAFTPSAWSQLINLLLAEQPSRPAGAAAVGAWLSPDTRSQVFEEIKLRSLRREDSKHPLFVRMFRPVGFSQFTAVRAVLSGRHSGTHLDDSAIADLFEGQFDWNAQAHVSRGTDTSAGYVVLDNAPGLQAAVHFRNSETGASSLSFSGGAYITAIGASVTVADRRVEALLTSAKGQTRRAHTLPRVRVTAEARASIAASRMGDDVTRATSAAVALSEAWKGALVDFLPGFDATAPRTNQLVAVVIDQIAERSKLTDTARALLPKLIEDTAALNDGTIPFLSSAWVAASLALLAREEPTAAGFRTLADEAGRWVVDGW